MGTQSTWDTTTHDFRISFQDLNSSNQTKPNQSTLPQKWSLLRMLPTTLVTRPASSPPALPRRPTRTSPRTATPTPARVPLQPRMLLVTSSTRATSRRLRTKCLCTSITIDQPTFLTDPENVSVQNGRYRDDELRDVLQTGFTVLMTYDNTSRPHGLM